MLHILGIRHHGVGSGKMVKRMLDDIMPDCILIEGPPEANEVLAYIGVKDLNPPVAMMMYDEKNSQSSTFYPFASYSPEWVGCVFANKNKITLAALDLPAVISLNTQFYSDKPPVLKESETNDIDSSSDHLLDANRDPLSYIAEIAGLDSGETWWEQQFEAKSSSDARHHFEAVMQVTEALREENLSTPLDSINVYREAYMRQIIREHQSKMYQNIVVICGAWHAPALKDVIATEKSDLKLLKSLPKIKSKIQACWIPWTNGRLSLHSGYGAGINSPGWYEHQALITEFTELSWLSKVASLFRKEGQDMSSAHVLECYKLAINLCRIRNKHSVTLQELNEAILTVMCMGDAILLELVKKELIVGERIGEVPDSIPKVPLQDDFEKKIKATRLKLSAAPKEYHLDLRNENDLNRSVLFHRLNILGIKWAEPTVRRSKGTFKESWELTWSPEMMLSIIDAAFLGNTIQLAADQKIKNATLYETQISVIVDLIDKVFPADLEYSIHSLLSALDDLSTISTDIQDIMMALPNLINIKRYGDVRKSDISILRLIIDKLLTKVCINLPMACYGLDETHSTNVFNLISNLQKALKINDDTAMMDVWFKTIEKILDKDGVNFIIRGCCCRLLMDAEKFEEEESLRRFNLALSTGNQPQDVASWVEGFLRGSGMILIYDDRLWSLLYDWIDDLDNERFITILPYLRRAFSKFEYGERRQIGAKSKKGKSIVSLKATDLNSFNSESAANILKTINYLMGRQAHKQ